MTQPADPTRTQELGRIHAAARRAGLDDDTYRALLERLTGKRSAGELTPRERWTVLAQLARPGAPVITLERPALVSTAQWKYLLDLASALHWDDRTFAQMTRHITGLDNPAWLDCPSARKLIVGVKKILAHRQATQGRAPRMPQRGNPRRV